MLLVALMLLTQAPLVDLERLSPDARKPAENYYQHYLMQPACIPSQLERLKAETLALSNLGGAAPWEIAQTMLCGTSAASRQFLISRMPTRVRSELYPADDTGGIAGHLVDRTQVEMLRGFAWEVTVAGDPGELIYSYDRGGVCAGSFTIRRAGDSWLLVGVSEACD